MKDGLLNGAMVVLTACAFIVSALVLRRELFSAPPARTAEAPRRVPDWRAYAGAGHRMGPAAAPVHIIIFSDFQCPFCGALAARLDMLQARHGNDVAVVYRHFPLEIHAHAREAARASECAGEQGRFAEFHDALFAAQDSIGRVPWSRFVSSAGVPDTSAFRKCAGGSGPVAAVERDMAAAERFGVTATPTLLVNEMRLEGAQPLDTLEAYVERALHLTARTASSADPK
jgi:protein-disulfide isomerase